MTNSILHCDINHCYAQIEEMKFPSLKEVPMAVGGKEESRHGIILAKNLLAKKCNIKTGETLREAYKKCPELLIIHPNYQDYIYYTEKVKDIYREYTDKVESFGLDEAWVDLTKTTNLFGSGYEIAKTIQKRVLNEIGLTISIGVSYNKIFAKLGSDLIKPSGLVEISKDNFKQVVWPLPVEDLLYIGRATGKKLEVMGIKTIGELATLDPEFLNKRFGKVGLVFHRFANGEDCSDISFSSRQGVVKSIGNSITAIRDILNYEDAKLVFYVLAESVASRLKGGGYKGKVISIGIRNNKLESLIRQRKIEIATNLVDEIMEVVMGLLYQNWDQSVPLRSIGIAVSDLKSEKEATQMSLFVSEKKKDTLNILERTIDSIRDKFGFDAVYRCCMLLDGKLTNFNPKGDHTIFPVSYF